MLIHFSKNAISLNFYAFILIISSQGKGYLSIPYSIIRTMYALCSFLKWYLWALINVNKETPRIIQHLIKLSDTLLQQWLYCSLTKIYRSIRLG